MERHPDDHLAEAFQMNPLEKLEWMIDATGWALEPVAADVDVDPPRPGYAYSIGLPAAVGFPEVVVFGLTPVAANGLVTLVADAARGGTDIPIGVEVVGLFDNDLRSLFAPVAPELHDEFFTTAVAWYRGAPFEVVQLLYPDRSGFLPYEAGYEQRMTLAQPVIGTVD